jgi:deoxyribonuclease-4
MLSPASPVLALADDRSARHNVRVSNRRIYVGAHVSAAGGVDKAPRNAHDISASAFALFTRNQRRWNSRPYEPDTVSRFHQVMDELGYSADQAVPHAGYLINLGSPGDDVREKSIAALTDELQRTVQLGLLRLNFHPGTSKGELGEDDTLKRIADGVDRVLAEVEGGELVLENTAGQGSSMGETVSQLARIIERVRRPDRVTICIDTCHAFAAGYDIRTGAGWDTLVGEVERLLGLEKLTALHLNDSTGELGSNKDRHKPIGDGEIGMDGFRAIMRDRRMDGKPMILETPEPDRWPDEITLLREFAEEDAG